MKKLKEELFITTGEVYGKELIDKLRQKIYDIGWAIISDEYLVILLVSKWITDGKTPLFSIFQPSG